MKGCDSIETNYEGEIPLSGLRSGESGVISRHLSPLSLRRFSALGLTPGTRVSCVGRSPLGDPSAYFFLGSVFAIRARDADLIMLHGSLGDV